MFPTIEVGMIICNLQAYGITHEKQSIMFDLPEHVSDEVLHHERSRYITGIPFMKVYLLIFWHIYFFIFFIHYR